MPPAAAAVFGQRRDGQRRKEREREREKDAAQHLSQNEKNLSQEPNLPNLT